VSRETDEQTNTVEKGRESHCDPRVWLQRRTHQGETAGRLGENREIPKGKQQGVAT